MDPVSVVAGVAVVGTAVLGVLTTRDLWHPAPAVELDEADELPRRG